MKMTDRQLQNRPREKMQKYEAGKLSDLELLMAIIGSGGDALFGRTGAREVY